MGKIGKNVFKQKEKAIRIEGIRMKQPTPEDIQRWEKGLNKAVHPPLVQIGGSRHMKQIEDEMEEKKVEQIDVKLVPKTKDVKK